LTYKINISNDKINVTVPGIYVIKLSVQDSFGNTTIESITVQVMMVSALHNDEISINSIIQISPNPVKNVIHFDLKNQAYQIMECMIFNPAGQLLLKEDFKSQFNISHLSEGNYYCTFKTTKESYLTLPFIKQ